MRTRRRGGFWRSKSLDGLVKDIANQVKIHADIDERIIHGVQQIADLSERLNKLEKKSPRTFELKKQIYNAEAFDSDEE